MAVADEMSLAAEAAWFHRTFFARALPREVAERYVRANRHCGFEADRTSTVVVERKLDAEAVEFALRLRGRGGVLTRKIQILFFLVEVRRDYYGLFVNETPMFGQALARLAASVALSGWKLAKGTWLVWRYRLG